MNYIDDILNRLHVMSADDIIQEIGGKIYSEPLDRDEILKYPQFIQDIIFLIDMDTELTMQGDVLVNSTGQHVPNMIVALKNIHADNDANLLQKIYDVYQSNPNYDIIWETLDDFYSRMYLYTDLDIWRLLNTYVEQEKCML